MKKICILGLGLLILSTNHVFADDKIAVVDLQDLVSNSSQVKQLKQTHSNKLKELDKIIVNARGEISNEKDPAKVLLLEDKYMKEFNSKKEALENEYNSKLESIERSIKTEISKKAQKEGYNYVFAKSVVLCPKLVVISTIKLSFSVLIYSVSSVNLPLQPNNLRYFFIIAPPYCRTFFLKLQPF
jgi:Skp family chaperone for outer membrane proteins